jgi:hypothetical protein
LDEFLFLSVCSPFFPQDLEIKLLSTTTSGEFLPCAYPFISFVCFLKEGILEKFWEIMRKDATAELQVTGGI